MRAIFSYSLYIALGRLRLGANPWRCRRRMDPNDYPNPYHVDEGWAKLGAHLRRQSLPPWTWTATAKASGCSNAAGKADDGLAPRNKTPQPGAEVRHFGQAW